MGGETSVGGRGCFQADFRVMTRGAHRLSQVRKQADGSLVATLKGGKEVEGLDCILVAGLHWGRGTEVGKGKEEGEGGGEIWEGQRGEKITMRQ